MRSASYLPSPDRERTPLSRRAVALLLALGVEALLVLMLLSLAPRPDDRRSTATKTVSFQLLPDAGRQPSRARTVLKAGHAGGGAARRSPTPRTPPLHPLPTPPLNLIPLTSAEFRASDITALPAHPDARQSAAADGAGSDSGAADGGGTGPGGERLYDADWYTHPTHAELATYLRADAPASGWGMIACRTVAKFRVEDCRELAESPVGSGLARAVREAAWQFRVLPPRIGGHPLVGAWVRIRIDYTERDVDGAH